jgi:OOP family OmpA-OmpF porin
MVKRSESDKLENIAGCLKGDNVAPVMLGGHADELGDEAYNLALSEKRALEVSRRLERLGVDSSRLSVQAFGETQPAVPGEGAQPKNRRVEFNPQP